ncbi:MAG TPA: hypothetical protein VL523_09445 [Terriglobia bacterium]|nr:hypothetical protein [Terriglobia bacterium]
MNGSEDGKSSRSILDLMDRSSARATPPSASIGDVPLGGAPTARPTAAGSEASGAQVHATAIAEAPPAKPAEEKHKGKVPATEAAKAKPSEPARRGSGGLWAAVVILTLALGGLAWYGGVAMRRNNVPLAQLPGMQRLMAGLNGRMDGAEARLRDLTASWGGVQTSMARLDRRVAASLQAAHRQTEELVNTAQARIEAEMHQRDRALDTRMAQLESTVHDQAAQLAEVQTQVGAVKRDVAAGQNESGREMAVINGQMGENRDALDALNQRLDRQKVTFEASKGAPHEVVPGITVTVTKTDVGYQRYGGYLTLERDGRTLWLSGVNAQQSVVFYPRESHEAYDLVVTSVNGNGVTGYLMLPAAGSEDTTPPDAAGSSAPGF